MTLKEALADIPEDEYVYIGTKNGSAWLYIAKRKELEEKLDELSDSQKQARQKKLDAVTESLDGMNKSIIQQNKIIETQKGIIEKALEELFDACSKIARITADFESERKTQKHLTEYLYDWKDLADREVIDAYPHKDIAPKGASFIIPGEETGKYWTLNELKKDENGELKEEDDGDDGDDMG